MSKALSTSASGQLEALLCTLCMLGITFFFPTYFKTWFVESTGNIKIAPFFGFLFGIGLLFGKQWARTGALVLGWGVLAISLFSIVSDSTRPGFWILLVIAAFLLYLLNTARLKAYVYNH
jgi:hypothetical protein